MPNDALPRCGDTVLHRPSGESWVVAWAEYDDLAWTGWPNGIARLADCDVTHRCTDAEHEKSVRIWVGVDDPRSARVLRLYGGAIAGEKSGG